MKGVLDVTQRGNDDAIYILRVTPTRNIRFVLVLVLVAALGVVLAACSSSSSSTADASKAPPSATTTTPTTSSAAWAKIDRELAGFGPEVSLLAARVMPDATCAPLHAVASSTARPTASQFKLFVLGTLANQIASGRVAWSQKLTVEDSVRSLGNGEPSLQFAPRGSSVSVQETATKMISISDNTAADMLINLVGRKNVEAQVRQWTVHASANQPFLKTREMFLLHYVKGLGDRYLATPASERDAFLASSVDPRPLSDIASGYSQDPRYVDKIEWFASPDDVCRAFAGLQQLSKNPRLSPLPTVLSRELGGIALDPSVWPTVWFKGGSEPGVLTLGWIATNTHGESFVVEAMVSNPTAALSADSAKDLVALGREAFGLLR
jgi:hypothetical protein